MRPPSIPKKRYLAEAKRISRNRLGRSPLERLSTRIGRIGAGIEDPKGALEVAWAISVGSGLARRTRLVGMEGSRLVIEVGSPAWQAAIEANAGRIKRKLYKILGGAAPTILEARVVPEITDSTGAQTKTETDAQPRPAPVPIPPGMLEKVEDPDLRRAIAAAFQAHQRRHGLAPEDNASSEDQD